MLTKLNRKHAGFTLVEIMIVVAIIALLAAIAVPGFLRARKRSQASKILNDLRMIDAAVDQYAIETNKKSNDVVGTAIGRVMSFLARSASLSDCPPSRERSSVTPLSSHEIIHS